MDRRNFLSLLGVSAAGFALDPERLLWVPSKKKIFDLYQPSRAQTEFFCVSGNFIMGNIHVLNKSNKPIPFTLMPFIKDYIIAPKSEVTWLNQLPFVPEICHYYKQDKDLTVVLWGHDGNKHNKA